MARSRSLALLLATFCLLAAPLAHAQIGIQPIQDQTLPSGKTLVVPIPATDGTGPARSYTVTIGPVTQVSGTTTVSATNAGIHALIRTGDPHFNVGVSYTDSNSVQQTGTMEFQLLREFAPLTTQIIAGLTQGGFYNPVTSGTTTTYVPFHRVVPGFVIQGGDPTGTGAGGPGFTFQSEFNKNLIFSGTAGQLAMANSGYGVNQFQTVDTPSFKTLHIFSALAKGANADGANPFDSLVIGSDGNFYGTASAGGAKGNGTIYRLTTTGTFQTLHSFGALGNGLNADGAKPYAALLSASNGILYGTTISGGAKGNGTIFQVTSAGVLKTLHSFVASTDGADPYGGVVTGSSGNLYGTTETGGTAGAGTLYQLAASGSFKTLHTFSALVTGSASTGGTNADGANPYARMTAGTDGNFYGTTETGGTNGSGTVFQLTQSGSFATLYAFSPLVTGTVISTATNADGAAPRAGLVNGPGGNLYGVAETGGTNGTGTVFQLTTSGSLTTIYTFSALAGGSNADGAKPTAGLLLGSDGNLYGTTSTGGANSAGTLFQLTTGGALTTLYSFSTLAGGTNADGANPRALVQASNGNFYGAAEIGGTAGNGTLFQLSLTTFIPTTGTNGTNGSQFFITLANNQAALDFKYNLFGQMLRGYDTLFGIAGTPVQPNSSGEDSSPVSPVDITSVTVTHNETDAVLLLSGTGVCQATVTVTASSGTNTATQTFTAYCSGGNAIDDPAFLGSVPNIAVPNGTAKVPLVGTDLQLDLLRYGYQRLLPFTDSSLPINSYTLTSSTSPVISVPLYPNTDNTVAAGLDHWNPILSYNNNDGRYDITKPDVRIFDIAAGDKPLTGSLMPIASGTGGSLALSGTSVLAVFTTGNPKNTAASFSAIVNWGDGTHLTNAAVVKYPPAANRYKVVAGHTFGFPGQFPLILNIADTGGARLTLDGTTNVSSSSIAISGTDITSGSAALTNQVLATFQDKGAASTASNYVAAIDWGDGTVSSGAVTAGTGSTYRVLGTHTYASADKNPDSFTISAYVTRTGTNGYSAFEWSTAHITNATGLQVFPPFPQGHLAQVWSSSIYSDTDTLLITGTNPGANPYATLFTGTDGNLYGVASQGGVNGLYGSAFELSTTGSLNRLGSFTIGNGAYPHGTLTAGTDGNLYGTAQNGGVGEGTIFRIVTSGSGTSVSGSLVTLYSFSAVSSSGTNTDGASPYAGLVTGADGNLYGVAEAGGTNATGTIFKITTNGSFSVVHTFDAVSSGTNADGANPFASLLSTGTDGNLYGTTEAGGANGTGTVFQLTVPSASSTSSSATFTSLYSFSALSSGTNADGANPFGSLITYGTDGNLYGTAEVGGTGGSGTVFAISLVSGSAGVTGSLSTLYSFSTPSGGINTDGANPYAGLVTNGTDGNFYGTTEAGGANGEGTVFQLTTGGVLTSLYSFSTLNNTGANSGINADGANPFGGLVFGPDGNLYGTTEVGGGNRGGTAFQISTGGSFSTIYAFAGSHFQVGLRTAVQIVNSGNLPVVSGSFAVFLDPNGAADVQSNTLSGSEIPFTANGQTIFSVSLPNQMTLPPGQSSVLTFQHLGSVTDTRLKLPVDYNPSGQAIVGKVYFSDPVGDFDGSQKLYSPGSF